jgi:hypothetical protein
LTFRNYCRARDAKTSEAGVARLRPASGGKSQSTFCSH